MKYFAFLVVFLLIPAVAHGQEDLNISLPPVAPGAGIAAIPEAKPAPALFAASTPVHPAAANAVSGAYRVVAPTAGQEPSVIGVFPQRQWQAYAGYTFLRFYEVPGITKTLNGFDLGVTYFPKASWFGIDGAMTAAFGTQMGQTAKFALALGGPRLRWSAPRGVEFWVHGLAGVSHFVPQTIYGGQSAFAYEAGGGIDIRAHHQRFAYRFEVDAVGTSYFGTYQVSPKASAGIVFKF